MCLQEVTWAGGVCRFFLLPMQVLHEMRQLCFMKPGLASHSPDAAHIPHRSWHACTFRTRLCTEQSTAKHQRIRQHAATWVVWLVGSRLGPVQVHAGLHLAYSRPTSAGANLTRQRQADKQAIRYRWHSCVAAKAEDRYLHLHPRRD